MPTNSNAIKHDVIEFPQHILRHIIENAGSSILITDDQGVIQYANKRFYEISGYSPSEAINKTPAIIRSNHTSHEVYKDLWSTINSGRTWRKTILNRRKSGELYWSLQSILPIEPTDGGQRHFLSISEDITELQNQNAELQKYAFQDDLTQLKNRRLFRKNVADLLKQQTHESYALFLLDIDNFKYFNDQHGHHFGDEILINTARLLEEACESCGDVYRLGGDEFAVILGPNKSETFVHNKISDILATFKHGFDIQDVTALASCSIGVALFNQHGSTPGELLRCADLALYHSKLKGKKQATFYSHAHRETHLSEYELLQALKLALNEQHIEVFGQRILDLSGQTPHAIECLLRWRHTDNTAISPIKTIETASRHGLLTKLSHYIFDRCIEQLLPHYQRLKETGVAITINLCPQQVMDEHLVDYFYEKLLEHKIAPEIFIFEITEDSKIDYDRKLKSFLSDIKAKGFRVAIDDFGSGYASFKYLYELQADYLKLDKSLLTDLHKHESKQAILTSMLELADKLNLTTIIEGVEEAQQLEQLKKLNINTLVQGYYYHRPQPLSETLETL